ncbi:hypothetical protein [Halorubrum vacuolatum]|uniref:PH domain-containing protein n=1 Tax=Halorubrum vacuolatum TaxID=63740 RepID=A0A238X0N6_HALVU|nr:hypothetical protein [Halorubrum vacuolatum]SNR52151.1 hypothetical protein SAMN06264855_1124 [Halorubrum vacuolatum]
MSNSTDTPSGESIVECQFQNGSISVYDTYLTIERAKGSNYENKRIEMNEIYDVTHTSGIITGHIQIHQHGVEPDAGGFFTHPVDENTLYFQRAKRSCAEQARDAIIERMAGDRAE